MRMKQNFTLPTQLCLLFCIVLMITSCKKTTINTEIDTAIDKNSVHFLESGVNNNSPACYDCGELQSSYADTTEHETILGNSMLNPYTLPNVTQAYKNLHNNNAPNPALVATHLYVKFSPTNFNELALLEDENVDFTTYPLDNEVIFDGDYYQQPDKGEEDVPYLYAVVPINYTFLQNIPYTILEQMYIPDNDKVLENEALRISGNLGDDNTQSTSTYNPNTQQISPIIVLPPTVVQPHTDPCDPFNPYYPASCDNNPNTGGGGGGSPTPINCANYPKGKITVQNKLTNNETYRAVRNVKVVVRRGFKKEITTTDDQGNFASSKYFRNKYTILVKFKNNLARIGRIRGIRVWEQFFPIKINFGKWKNLDCGHEFQINNPTATKKIATSHWAAATAFNAVQEHREMCQQEGVGTAPQKLHILLKKGNSSNSGNTFMFNKILTTGGAVPYALTTAGIASIPIVGGPAATFAALWAIRAPDIVFGYGGETTYFFATDQYCELVYHELSHANHYAKVGNVWWINFGLDEKNNRHNGTGTYGPCCTSEANSIAVGEGWAYHFGHYLADKKWGLQCTEFPEQGDRSDFNTCLFFNNSGGFSSHHNFLEEYNPNRDLDKDPNRWLPKGLFNDMMDGGLENQNSTIIDNVSGFSNTHFFNALTNNINSMEDYKILFLQQNNNQQQTQIYELFNQYGY